MIFKDLIKLKGEIVKLKNEGKSIVWTNGCYDILHPGHLETFKRAKEFGDILIVGINGDNSLYWKTKPGRPINNEDFRSGILDSIRYIDFVFIYQDETPLNVISEILPNFLIKGGDYISKEIIGYDVVIQNGGEVITVPILNNYSTSNMINKILTIYK